MSRHTRQRNAEQHAEEDDLQHFVFCRRFEETLRHRVLQHTRQCWSGGGELFGVSCAGGCQRHAGSWLHEIHREQSDGQRERGNDFKVNNGTQRQSSDLLHVIAMPCDADHQCAEQQRHYDRLDHAQEDRGQQLQALPEFREQPPDECADDHRDDDPLGDRKLLQQRHAICVRGISGRDLRAPAPHRSCDRCAARSVCIRTGSTARDR